MADTIGHALPPPYGAPASTLSPGATGGFPLSLPSSRLCCVDPEIREPATCQSLPVLPHALPIGFTSSINRNATCPLPGQTIADSTATTLQTRTLIERTCPA
jgi:hypothetical protein